MAGPPQGHVGFARRRLLGRLDERPQDDGPLLSRDHVQRAGNAGLPLEQSLPQPTSDVTDVKGFLSSRIASTIASGAQVQRPLRRRGIAWPPGS
jgi:hypothetical protein